MFFLVGPVNLVSEVPMKNHSLTTEPPRNRKEAKQRFLPYNQLKQCSLPPQTRLAEAVGSSPLSLLAPGHPPDAVFCFSLLFPLNITINILCNHIFPKTSGNCLVGFQPCSLTSLRNEWMAHRASLECDLMSKRKRDLEGPRDGIKHH